MNFAECGQKELCKCSRRDATYGALVVMAMLIIMTLLREAPLIVIVADNKRADSFMRHYHAESGFQQTALSTEHGPPVPVPEISTSDTPEPVTPSAKEQPSTTSGFTPATEAAIKKRPLRVFTVATNISHTLFTQFYDSARRNKVHVEVLGEGDTLMYEIPLSAQEKRDPKNKKAFHARANFGRKLLHLHKACEDLPNKDTLVVLVDSYDSLFVGADLVAAYERAREMAVSLVAKGELPPEIITGGELNCWPDKNMTGLYPKYSLGQKMRYVNSGVVAGPASAFLKLFRNFLYTGTESSDQRYWASAFIQSQLDDALPVIDIDYQGHLVATISKSSWPLLSFKRGKPNVQGIVGKPQILHLPNNKDRVAECAKFINNKGSTV